MESPAPPPVPPAATGLWSQIRAFDRVFWICIFMELMERMAYYGVRLVVPVYMVLGTGDGGPGLNHAQKGTILALWAAMQSWLPTFAGGFSDRFGYKRTLAISVFLKASGYFFMALAGDFWGMLLGTQLLAAGTGLFKPGIQGTMAHSIAKAPGASSMGWGLFYQSVNVGAAVSAYIPKFTRDVFGWHSVFIACTGIVLFNLIPLFFYEDPVDERASAKDERSVGTLLRESFVSLFTSPVLLGFIFLSAGFWFSFHQLFDMLPNYVDDWTDSSKLLRDMGNLLGIESWVAEANAGKGVPQERLLNINALMIMFTMFIFAWLSSRVRVLTSTMIGMVVASGAFALFVFTADVYMVLVGVAVFTIGEMFSSPKRQEYMASLAPPGKRALYLGYANMPDGIGWVLGSFIAGSQYEEHGDKVNLARAHLAKLADPAAVSAARTWAESTRELATKAAGLPREQAEALLAPAGSSPAELEEIAKNLEVEVAQLPDALSQVAAMPEGQVVARVTEVLPRGDVVEFFTRAVPTLPDGTAATAATVRDYLFATYQPGQVWLTFLAVGGISVVGMFLYDRWLKGRGVVTV